jgi:hypothetical protein
MKPAKNLFLAALSLALLAAGRLAAAPIAADQAPAAASAASGIGNAAAYNEGSARYLLDHPRALAKFLDLSLSEETTQLNLWNTLQSTLKPLHQARPALCEALIGDLGAASPDPSTIGSATLALYDNRGQILAAHQTFVTSFSAILSPAQLAAYDALRKLAFPGDEDYAVIGYCPHQTS